MIKRIQYHHHSGHWEKQHNRTYIISYLAGETVLDIYTYDGILQIPSNKNKELGFPSLDVHNLLLNWLSATWHLNPSYTNYRWKLSCAVIITVIIFHHNRLQSTQKKRTEKVFSQQWTTHWTENQEAKSLTPAHGRTKTKNSVLSQCSCRLIHACLTMCIQHALKR